MERKKEIEKDKNRKRKEKNLIEKQRKTDMKRI